MAANRFTTNSSATTSSSSSINFFSASKPSRLSQVLLDIDDTIATQLVDDATVPALVKEGYTHLQWFNDNNLIFENMEGIGFYHPGAIELSVYLIRELKLKVGFFSGESKERNIELVRDFLTRALGSSAYESIKDSVSIYSRHHLDIYYKKIQSGSHLYSEHYYCKNLLKILSPEEVKNTILIDNDATFIAPDQEKNVLLVPGVDNRHFYDCSRIIDGFGSDDELLIPKLNQIFYIAGLLKTALDGEKPVTENLFHLQYKNDGKSWQPNHPFSDCSYYLIGLQELQKVNPKLEFYGGKLAEQYFSKKLAENLKMTR